MTRQERIGVALTVAYGVFLVVAAYSTLFGWGAWWR